MCLEFAASMKLDHATDYSQARVINLNGLELRVERLEIPPPPVCGQALESGLLCVYILGDDEIAWHSFSVGIHYQYGPLWK